MRTLVTIEKCGADYISSVSGRFMGGYRGANHGSDPQKAAAVAARLMADYSSRNPEGGDLIAPPEILALLPPSWRSIEGTVVAAFVEEEPREWLNMDTHFLELVRKGRLPGASSGEVKALVLACAVVDEVPGLDSRATKGLCEFVWFVSNEPQTAKEILRGLRSEDS